MVYNKPQYLCGTLYYAATKSTDMYVVTFKDIHEILLSKKKSKLPSTVQYSIYVLKKKVNFHDILYMK